MTQPSRTTETINRDNAAIRDLMQQVRELTVPDRATLALGLVGHLATMMNRSQMKKLMAQLQEEAERVQDVPPNRQRADDAVADPPADAAEPAEGSRAEGGRAEGGRAEGGRAEGGRAEGGRAEGGRAEGGRAAKGGRAAEGGRAVKADRADRKDSRMAAERQRPTESRKRHGDVMAEQMVDGSDTRRDAEASRERADGSRQGVGQAGRGEFRWGRLL